MKRDIARKNGGKYEMTLWEGEQDVVKEQWTGCAARRWQGNVIWNATRPQLDGTLTEIWH